MSSQDGGAGSRGDDGVFTGRQKHRIKTPQWLRENGEASAAADYGIPCDPQVTASSSAWETEDKESDDDDQDCIELIPDVYKTPEEEKASTAFFVQEVVKETAWILGPFLEKLGIKSRERQSVADAQKAEADAEMARWEAERSKLDTLKRAREEMDDLIERVDDTEKKIKIQKAKPGGGNQRIIKFLERNLARSYDHLEELSRKR